MKRSGPLKRGTTRLKRSRLKARRGKQRRSSRIRDVGHMLLVKELPCSAAHLSDCSGPHEADHVGARGLGQKCSDYDTICLCALHHRQRTDFSGPFKHWGQSLMRAFLDAALRNTRRALIPVKTRIAKEAA